MLGKGGRSGLKTLYSRSVHYIYTEGHTGHLLVLCYYFGVVGRVLHVVICFHFTFLTFFLSTLYFNEGEHTARSDKYDLTSRNYTTNIHLQSPTTISFPFFFFFSCMKECCTLPLVGASFRCISYTNISTVL
ncbi:hypothetical protein BDV36DRAFT_215606 [Aspergillus pseudocaelatus]|uniref:Uncharacterized protein n=1 Tax=Aspergillus pseudocaelatus TaxID=1825620 RepID=A0ABQ6WFI8_9EURO|nr:hypothetical protein BDV36DRAFT_215606 [Aspergillus pseudocaelatus]